MAIIIFISWWYTEGWVNTFASITKRLRAVSNELSIPILFSTLFEPWKQITLYAGNNSSFDLKMHVLAENLFSRTFGFIIRSFVIIIGFIALILVAILGLVLAVFWPVVPLLPLFFVYMAVVNI